jgi:hypothetical protein
LPFRSPEKNPYQKKSHPRDHAAADYANIAIVHTDLCPRSSDHRTLFSAASDGSTLTRHKTLDNEQLKGQ